MAGSIALVGFGFDSLIEVTSGAALLWRLHADVDEERRERVEAINLRIVGVCFVVLALYVGYDSVKSLIRREAPEESLIGIVLAAVSLRNYAIACSGEKENSPGGRDTQSNR